MVVYAFDYFVLNINFIIATLKINRKPYILHNWWKFVIFIKILEKSDVHHPWFVMLHILVLSEFKNILSNIFLIKWITLQEIKLAPVTWLVLDTWDEGLWSAVYQDLLGVESQTEEIESWASIRHFCNSTVVARWPDAPAPLAVLAVSMGNGSQNKPSLP